MDKSSKAIDYNQLFENYTYVLISTLIAAWDHSWIQKNNWFYQWFMKPFPGTTLASA